MTMTKPEIVGSTRVVRMVCEEKGIDYTMMPRCLLAVPRLRGRWRVAPDGGLHSVQQARMIPFRPFGPLSPQTGEGMSLL
jgi:hypothetical protein